MLNVKFVELDENYKIGGISPVSNKSQYRSGTVNSNTVNSKFHLIRSNSEIFFLSFS